MKKSDADTTLESSKLLCSCWVFYSHEKAKLSVIWMWQQSPSYKSIAVSMSWLQATLYRCTGYFNAQSLPKIKQRFVLLHTVLLFYPKVWSFIPCNYAVIIIGLSGGTRCRAYHTQKHRGKNFHKWLRNGEFHENFLLQKFPTILYLSQLLGLPVWDLPHALLPYHSVFKHQLLDLIIHMRLVTW